MFPNANTRRIGPFRMRGNSLASTSESGSFRGLSETTNRPRGAAPKFKTDILPSPPTSRVANSTLAYDHADFHSKDGLRKALLSSDWRQRPSGSAPENLPQVRTLANYRHEPQPYKTETFDQALQQREMRRQDSISQGEESSGVANNQQSSSHDENGAFNESSQGSDGDRGDKNSSPNNIKQPIDRFRMLELGPKHFVMLSNLLGPAPCGENGNTSTSANGSPSNEHHGFRLATVSDSIFGLPTDILPAGTIKPTVELQEVISINGLLRPRPWDSLGNDSDHHPRLQDSDSSHDTWSSYEVVEKSRSEETGTEEPSEEEATEDKRFENMLAKLKTGTFEKTADPQVSDGGQWNKHKSYNLGPSSRESTSKDSSASAADQFVGEKISRPRATTLNPKAPSFFTVGHDTKPATYAARSRREGHRLSISELFNRPLRAVGEANTLYDSPRNHLDNSRQPERALDNEMLLAEKIKRAVLDSQQIEELTGAPPTDSQVQAIMQRLGIRSPKNQIKPWTQAPNIASLNTRGQPTPIQQLFSSQGWNQHPGPSTVPRVIHGGSGPRVLPPLGPAMNSGHVISLASALPLPGPEIDGHANAYIPNTFLPPAMPGMTQESGLHQRGESSIKDIMSNISNELCANQVASCTDEPRLLGPLCIPPIGPKPVMKPKGPPRPHDAMWHKKQQEYEAYLEHQRAQNPTYHRECRDRQAKRADRKKQEDMSRHFVFPPKESAAIAIKKPDEVAAAV